MFDRLVPHKSGVTVRATDRRGAKPVQRTRGGASRNAAVGCTERLESRLLFVVISGGLPDTPLPLPSAGLANLNGTLYFTQETAAYGRELWRSDGTAAGTVMVTDINPGPASGVESGADPLAVYRGRLFFVGADARGSELWSSDGTAEGTSLFADINPGPDGSAPWHLTVAAEKLFFGADDGTHGAELWWTDGTAAGTALFKDLSPGPIGSDPRNLRLAPNGFLFFDAWPSSNRWRTNGTVDGTVETRYGDPAEPALSIPTAYLGGIRFFPADRDGKGFELWMEDAAGERLAADIQPGPSGSSPLELTAVGDKLYFTADDGRAVGRQVWVWEGGTARVLDAVPPTAKADLPEDGARRDARGFFVLFEDNIAVDPASIAGNQAAVRVSGPNGFEQFARHDRAVRTDPPPRGSHSKAVYFVDAPGGEWDASENGTYTLTLVGGALKDAAGNAAPEAALGAFTVLEPLNAPDLVTSVSARLPAESIGREGLGSAVVTVSNTGTRPADGAWSILLSLNDATGDTRLEVGQWSARKLRLEPGASKSFKTRFRIPDLRDGTYTLTASAIPGDGVVELRTMNNAAAGPTMRIIRRSVDLAASLPAPPTTLARGGKGRLRFHLRNNGGVGTVGGFSAYVLAFPPGESLHHEVGRIRGTVRPGAEKDFAINLSVPKSLPPGTYRLEVYLSAADGVFDPNESNNTLSTEVLVV